METYIKISIDEEEIERRVKRKIKRIVRLLVEKALKKENALDMSYFEFQHSFLGHTMQTMIEVMVNQKFEEQFLKQLNKIQKQKK